MEAEAITVAVEIQQKLAALEARIDTRAKEIAALDEKHADLEKLIVKRQAIVDRLHEDISTERQRLNETLEAVNEYSVKLDTLKAERDKILAGIDAALEGA